MRTGVSRLRGHWVAIWVAVFAMVSPSSGLERLGRGLIVVPMESGGNFVSWRLLPSDPADVSFVVLRDGVVAHAEPLGEATSWVDPFGGAESSYTVTSSEAKATPSQEVEPWAQEFLEIPLEAPATPVLPTTSRWDGYRPGDGAVGDLDGDGAWELVFKWVGREQDPSRDGFSSPTIIEAIRLDGSSLWRVELGINVRSGAHYTPFLVYDLDGDGRSELVCRTSDGTIDGRGKVLGSGNHDHLDERGRVLKAPEFLTVFDGTTGAALASVPYEPGRGSVESWGDTYGNRSERHLMAVAYLDGMKPSVVTARGYYRGQRGRPGRTAMVAWDFGEGMLATRWRFDTWGREDLNGYLGQGAHSIAVGDVDGDGRDEILYGAMAVDDDGSGLYTTGLGHGDATHLGDFDPARPGLEFFMPHENAAPGKIPGLSFRDAATGTLLWSHPVDRPRDIGRGACADIFSGSPGAEAWGLGRELFGVDGQVVGPAPRTLPNFFVWWDGDATREILNENWIAKYNPASEGGMDRLLVADGCRAINGSKATPLLSADLFGDWREEVVWPSRDGTSLRVYTTTIPTRRRVPTLMSDRLYRLSIAWQNVAYNQPPHLSYSIGE